MTSGARDGFIKLFALEKSPLGISRGKKGVWPEITDQMVNQMIRFFFLDVVPPAIIYNGFGESTDLSLALAKDYFPSVLEEIMDAQEEKATKRAARVEERINELKAKKKELAKETKPKPVAKKK